MTALRARAIGGWTSPWGRQVIYSAGGSVATVRAEGRLTVLSLADGAELAGFPDAGALGHAVSPDLSFAVARSAEGVRAVGGRAWFFPYASETPGSLLVSADGRHVWAALPGVGGQDRWLVLDAGSGTVLAEAGLDTSQAGSSPAAHPDGRHVGLSIGEGQEGAVLVWGRFEDGRIHHWRAEDDLVLADIAPGGAVVLTIAHDQSEAVALAFPGGDRIWAAPGELIEREPHEPDEDLFWDYYAGFVDDRRVLLSDVEYDEDERAGHYLLDAATGEGLGEIEYPDEVTGYPRPLGDGTWLTASDEAVTRWTLG